MHSPLARKVKIRFTPANNEPNPYNIFSFIIKAPCKSNLKHLNMFKRGKQHAEPVWIVNSENRQTASNDNHWTQTVSFLVLNRQTKCKVVLNVLENTNHLFTTWDCGVTVRHNPSADPWFTKGGEIPEIYIKHKIFWMILCKSNILFDRKVARHD